MVGVVKDAWFAHVAEQLLSNRTSDLAEEISDMHYVNIFGKQ